MKSKYKISYLSALVFILTFFSVANISIGASRYNNYNNPDYSRGSFVEQYYISPLMTSTSPYGYQNYSNNGYYFGNNNFQYNYPPDYYLSNYNSSYLNSNYIYSNSNYNSNYNYNYPYYNYSTIFVNCWVNNYTAYVGQPVTWASRVSGGGGGYYSYNWSGTDNPRSLNLGSINVSYQIPGTKTMNLTVIDQNGRSATASCGSATVGQSYYPNYPISYFR